MSTPSESHLSTVRRYLFEASQRWWIGALGLKFAAYIVGVGGVVLAPPSWAIALATAALAFVAEGCSLRSDFIRSAAESLHRKLELQDGLEWKISDFDKRDLVARFPHLFRDKLKLHSADTSYFASQHPPHPQRVAANVEESAFWSKHNAGATAALCAGLTIVLVLISVAGLMTALLAYGNSAVARENGAKIVTATLLLLFSLTLVPLCLKYDNFRRKSEEAEKAAIQMKNDNPDIAQAIKLLFEYQHARAASPMLPSFIYWRKRDNLNAAWAECHPSTPQAEQEPLEKNT